MHVSSISIRFTYIRWKIYGNNVMIYFEKHDNSEVNSPMLKSSPSETVLHSCNTGERGVVTLDPSYGSSLNHLDLADISFSVGAPNTGCLLYLRTNQGLVCQLFNFFIFSCDISFEKA